MKSIHQDNIDALALERLKDFILEETDKAVWAQIIRIYRESGCPKDGIISCAAPAGSDLEKSVLRLAHIYLHLSTKGCVLGARLINGLEVRRSSADPNVAFKIALAMHQKDALQILETHKEVIQKTTFTMQRNQALERSAPGESTSSQHV